MILYDVRKCKNKREREIKRLVQFCVHGPYHTSMDDETNLSMVISVQRKTKNKKSISNFELLNQL